LFASFEKKKEENFGRKKKGRSKLKKYSTLEEEGFGG